MLMFKILLHILSMQKKIDAYERSFEELYSSVLNPRYAKITSVEHPKGSCVTKVFKFITFVVRNHPEVIDEWIRKATTRL